MGNEQSSAVTSRPQEKATPQAPKSGGIVVVGTKEDSGHPEKYLDNYITRLHDCPEFKPILQSSNQESRPNSGDFVSDLDWKASLRLCSRLQDHLHACAEAVSFDQNSLTAQVKQVEALSARIMQKYVERQRAFAKYAEHTKKIEEISGNLKKVRMNLDQTFSLLHELNDILPEEDRLEPFSGI